jgi:hypothetical protein
MTTETAAFAAGIEDGMKLASYRYVPEEHRVQRKIERHEDRGYDAEKRRLTAKGERQGKRQGGVAGALIGGAAGALAGSTKGRTLKGGVAGAILGAGGGRAIGKSVGRAAGKTEARDRTQGAKAIKHMSPEERRSHFKNLVRQRHHEEMADLRRREVETGERREFNEMARSAKRK